MLFAQANNGAPVLFNEPMPFVLTQDSRLWLEGSASVVDFECRAVELSTRGGLEGLDTLSQVPAPHGESISRLTFRLVSLIVAEME